MNAERKNWALLVTTAALLCGAIFVWLLSDEASRESAPVPVAAAQPGTDAPDEDTHRLTAAELVAANVEPSARVTEERHKARDREHLRQLHRGLFDYQKIHGHFPEYLSQLVPDFVSAEALQSPRNATAGMNSNLADHADPGNDHPAYGYEFSNLVFRDDRTFADIKEVQRAEWGDAIPILRAFGYGKVINMSYGGAIYETELNWEWDSATLDVVRAQGWGPGLSAGQFTEVRVLGADGRPLAGAQVWADGRRYSFDLPNRPFATDANGLARVPLGADLDRTALALRVEARGLASPTVTFPLGQPPESYNLRAEPAQLVGGRVTDVDGGPIPNTWIYLRAPVSASGAPGANLGVVKTDASGQWVASLHPKDAAAFGISISRSGSAAKFSPGEAVDPTAAAARGAVSILSPPTNPRRAAAADGQLITTFQLTD